MERKLLELENLLKQKKISEINNLLTDFPNLKKVLNECDDIIKNLQFDNTPKIKIKLYWLYTPSDILIKFIQRLFNCYEGYKNLIFITNDKEADFIIVIDGLFKDEKIGEEDYKKSIYIEGMHPKFRNYLPKEWQTVPNNFLKVVKYIDNLNLGNCYLPRIIKYENNTQKENRISVILENNYVEIGNVKKTDFTQYLDQKNIEIDVYGNNKFHFKNYQGEINFFELDKAFDKYKYAIITDNRDEPDFFSGNILDCILSETVPIYWGCPNIERWIDPNCFIRMEFSDFQKDYDKVKKILNNDVYNSKLIYLKKEKERILNSFQILENIFQIINTLNK
jgi:hypothetical protein